MLNEITTYIVLGILVILGGVPTIYILISAPVVIFKKLYRKIKYGCKFTD